jgi:tetratricopeptide (TPR) repeat protein
MDRNVELETLHAVERDARPVAAGLRPVLAALRRLSPEWADALAEILSRSRRVSPRADPRTALTIERLGLAELPAMLPGLAAAAVGELARLRRAPEAERLRLLRRRRGRCANPALLDLLLAECRHTVSVSPRTALSWLDLADECFGRLLARGASFELLAGRAARLHAYRGNALRVAGDLPAADAAFARLAADPARAAVVEPAVDGELLSLEASLRRDQRQFHEALLLLATAEELFQREGGAEQVGMTAIQLGATELRRGEPQEALAPLARAAELLDPVRHPRLHLMARHNLALARLDLGEVAAAAEIIKASQSVYDAQDDAWWRPLRWWLAGRLAREQGEPDEAERHLRQARNAYIEQGIGFSMARVSLDLAELYLAAGNWREVKRLAGQMEPIFEAQDVHAEARAALILFQKAARAESLTTVFVAALRRYLETAARDRRFRFEPSAGRL